MFAVCIDNVDYPASLESRKLYEIMPDDHAASHRQLRVIDESGEDHRSSAFSVGHEGTAPRGVEHERSQISAEEER